MKKQMIVALVFGMLAACLILLTAFQPNPNDFGEDHPSILDSKDLLKKEALEILDTKCNVCHRKQNPFMVFNAKNMERRAKKVYEMVFLECKMPKGNEIRLTNEEYSKLKKWLFTQKIF